MHVARFYIKSTDGRGRKTRYVTVTTPSVTFREVHRDTKAQPFGSLFRQVEHAGWDKSNVTYFIGETTGAINAWGRKAMRRWLTFKLLERNSHVREVTEDDAARLAEFDQEITSLEEQVAQARERRAEFMTTVWKHGRKLGLSDLEDPAKETLEAREAAKAAHRK